MIDIKPGEDIICVRPIVVTEGCASPIEPGAVYVCEAVYIEPHTCRCGSHWAVEVFERPEDVYCACHFRPVTRTRDTLSIESFMTIKTGQPEGPRRVVGPVSPKKEKV